MINFIVTSVFGLAMVMNGNVGYAESLPTPKSSEPLPRLQEASNADVVLQEKAPV